jgi:NAD(P)-dependent dehydrogenase (short-subunit alcohol dehydrogenase family)
MAGLEERGVRLLEVDVTDDASVAAAMTEVVASAGRIDLLINNAGEWHWEVWWLVRSIAAVT